MGSRARIACLAADANTSYLAGDYRSAGEGYRAALAMAESAGSVQPLEPAIGTLGSADPGSLLKQFRSWPHSSHRSRWPPKADVRHNSIAVMARRCAVDIDAPMLLAVGFAVAAEDIRHFQLGTIHEPAAQKCRGVAGLCSVGMGRGKRS